MKIVYNAIGTIRTPYTKLEGMPIQPAGAKGVGGTVEVFPAYREGLHDLSGFSHIMLLYHFHLSSGFRLRVTPFLDSRPRGLFATRAPKRPNPIGLSVVRLKRVEGLTLHVENVDMADETPLLDIKPYAPAFDYHRTDSVGWLEGATAAVGQRRSDARFR
jgi:tRNA-Thr(GGU) m(6)t(6)A37 methyltransferase TsaA